MALTQFPGPRGRSAASQRTPAAWLVLALLAGCRADTCPPHDTLGHMRYLPHPRDCAMFLRCHQGREVPGRCPHGTAFLPEDGVCGDRARSSCAVVPCGPRELCWYQCSCSARRRQLNCPANIDFPVKMYVSEAGCERGGGTFPLLGNKVGRAIILRGASSFSVKVCPEGLPPERSYVPHFADCSKVVVCEGDREVASECPEGFLFSRELGYCEESRFVNCSAAPAKPPAEGCPPEAALMHCSYSCDCPLQTEQLCPPRLQLSSRLSIFDSNSHPACLKVKGATDLGDHYVATGTIVPNSTTGNYCPSTAISKPTYIAHPTDCESFIVCYRGAQSVRRCPAGRQYNPTTQRCGEPDASLCLSSSSSSSGRPPPPLSLPRSLQCPTSWVCSAAYKGVPHISDCTLFCRCDGAKPVLAACPPGLHFHSLSQTCEDPAIAKCRPTCAQLGKLNGSGGEDRGIWHPKSCIDADSKLGTRCSLKCFPKYMLDGSVRVRCTRQGWASNGVLNIIPTCRAPEEIGSNFVSKINDSLAELGNRLTEMLFIIDEANKVTAQQFEIQKRLVASIIRIFPLSQQRLAGVATLSSQARVYIRLIKASTCDFLAELQSLGRNLTNGGGTKRPLDITETLEAVEADMDSRGTASRALVFLITSKRSRSKPLPAASELKKSHHSLFTVGVGKFNRKQLNVAASRHRSGSKLFFGLSSVKAAKKMIVHMEREYGSEESNYCF